MAVTGVCGFECRDLGASTAANPNEDHWDSVTGSPTISTTTVRTGAAALRCNATGAATSLDRNIARRVVAGRVYFRIATLPGSVAAFIRMPNANGNVDVECDSAGVITAKVGSGSRSSSAGTVSTGVWYRLDFLAETNTGTASLKIRLDGGTEQQSTNAQTAADMTAIQNGWKGATTADIFFDDGLWGDATSDYPFGEGTVEPFRPSADGTHSFTAGDFGYNTAGANVATSATDVWSFVDDADMTSTADLIRQKVIRSTGYVEVAFGAAPHSWDAVAMAVVSSWHAAGTGADTIGMKLNDGGTLKNITDEAGDGLSDVSNTTIAINEKIVQNRPSTGTAWTAAAIAAIKIRVGYSTDVNAIPYWDGVLLEIAYGPSPGGTLFTRTMSDALTSADAWTEAGSFTRTLTNSITQADVWTRLGTIKRTWTSALTSLDAWTRAATLLRSWTQAVQQSDTWTRAGTLARSVAGAITQSDGWTRTTTATRTLAGAVQQSDAWVGVKLYARTLTEAVTSLDAWARAGTYVRTWADAATQADAWSRATSAARSWTSSVTSVDAWSRVAANARALTETLTSLDAWTRTGSYLRSWAQGVQQSDAWTRLNGLSRTLTGAVAQSDAWSGSKVLIRSWGDSVAQSDAWLRLGSFTRQIAQGVQQGDAWTRSTTAVRGWVGGLTSSDAWSRAIAFSRTTTGALTSSDAWARVGTFRRTLAEGVTSSDEWIRQVFGLNPIAAASGLIREVGIRGSRIVAALTGGRTRGTAGGSASTIRSIEAGGTVNRASGAAGPDEPDIREVK